MSAPYPVAPVWIIGVMLLFLPGCVITMSEHERILAEQTQQEREEGLRKLEAAVAHTTELVTADLETRHAEAIQVLHAKFDAERERIDKTNKAALAALEKRYQVDIQRLKDSQAAEIAAAKKAGYVEGETAGLIAGETTGREKEKVLAAKQFDKLDRDHKREIETTKTDALREGWTTATILTAMEQQAVFVGLVIIVIIAGFISIDRRSKAAFRSQTVASQADGGSA